jgi:hypothetical protein
MAFSENLAIPRLPFHASCRSEGGEKACLDRLRPLSFASIEIVAVSSGIIYVKLRH